MRFDLDDYARDDFFRAYTCDLSLLIAMKDYALKQHIVENTLGGNTKATSLIKLTESNTNIVRAYKLIDGNVGTEDGRIITIPLYMAMFV